MAHGKTKSACALPSTASAATASAQEPVLLALDHGEKMPRFAQPFIAPFTLATRPERRADNGDQPERQNDHRDGQADNGGYRHKFHRRDLPLSNAHQSTNKMPIADFNRSRGIAEPIARAVALTFGNLWAFSFL